MVYSSKIEDNLNILQDYVPNLPRLLYPAQKHTYGIPTESHSVYHNPVDLFRPPLVISIWHGDKLLITQH
jgi:hypothetical protein